MFALVDDWGNPSPTGIGTDWFGFASLFYRDNQTDQVKRLYHRVCQCLGYTDDTPIHSRKLDFNSKYHINRLIAEADLDISIIAVHIHSVESEMLKQRGWAYRFYAREIIRSATHFANEHGELAKVTFHRHKYLDELEFYIRDRLQFTTSYISQDPPYRILYDKLLDICIKDDEQEPLLGLADSIAHACHMALIPGRRWHAVNPTCLNLLEDCIWQGPSYDRNPRLFGIQLEPGGIPLNLIQKLPAAIRQYWE